MTNQERLQQNNAEIEAIKELVGTKMSAPPTPLYDTTGDNTDGAMTQAASTNAFALKEDIPDTSGFITDSQLQAKGYITADDLSFYDTTGDNTDGAMTQEASTRLFAQKSEIPDTSNLLPKSEKSHPVIFIRGTVPEEEVGQISREYRIFDENLNIGDKVRLFYCKFGTDTASLYLDIQEFTGKIVEVTSDYYKYSIISGCRAWFIPAILSSVCVTLTGKQTVSGDKTFTGTVIVPDVTIT